MFSHEFQRWAREAWEARAWLWKRAPAWAEALSRAQGDEAVCFQAAAATLPPTDLGDVPPELVMGMVRHGLEVREEFPWCGALPERDFFKYVLYPRINNEELSECRGLFRRELRPRLEGLTLPEAILEVNRWCAENVTYRSTDGRTASALAVYRCGWGRCGEESLFAVNALRSVGIAARQIYAPWWSHCDDNHAWVEAWDGERWRYLGACEPEPRLDMGWFTPAAGRAMLIHTRVFAGEGDWRWLFPEADPLDLDLREGVAYESVTARYAGTRAFRVKVTGPDGPAAGAKVGFYLLNEGALRPIGSRVAGEDGVAALNLGRGSLWVLAQAGGLTAESLVHTGETDCVELTLGAAPVGEGTFDFDFAAPPDGGVPAPALTDRERGARNAALEESRARREARGSLVQGEALAPELEAVSAVLTEKDRAQSVSGAVLEDSRGAYQYQNAGLPEDVFRSALLSPRFGTEPLAPWREPLAGVREAPPETLWPWLEERIARLGSFGDLPQTPAGAWRLQAAAPQGLRTLYCALCRAKGIPARLGAGGEPEVWRDGKFRLARGCGHSKLLVHGKPQSGGKLGLMVWKDGWTAQPSPVLEAETLLPPGAYRLICSTRLPNGNQLARGWDFTLAPGERRECHAGFREAKAEDMAYRLALPDPVLSREGKESTLKEVLAQADYTLLCWLDPGAEPTEHLLGEVKAAREKLAALGCQVVYVGDGKAGLWQCAGEVQETLARRLYLEPGVLPLAVLADRNGDARYACAGYNVGSVELAGGIVEALRK